MSLVGFTLLGTIEVPSITGSATAVPLLVKPNTEFTTAMLAALDAGGGDLRFGTEDGTTQYPCEIVDGLNIVWMTPTGLSVASAATVGVWGDNTGASQPAVGAAFGRNAVWVNSAISSHLTESSGTVATDSAGNRNGTYNGALPTVGANFGQDLNGTTDYITYGNTALGIATAFTFSLKIKPDTIGTVQQLFQADDTLNTIRNWQWRIDADGKVRIISFDSGGSIIANTAGTLVLAAGTEYIVNYVWDGSAYRSYINGSQDVSVASVTNILDLAGTGFGASVGGRQGGSGITDYFNGQAGDLDVIAGAFKTADQISIEYNNQSTAGSWWIAADAGGGTNAAITIPKPVFSSAAQAIAPVFNAAVNFTVSKPVFASTAQSVAPITSGDVNFTIGKPEFSATAQAIPAGSGANADITISKPVFASTAQSIAPIITADVAFSITAPIFSATAQSLGLSTSADVSIAISKPEFSATAQAIGVDNNATVSFNIASPIFSVFAGGAVLEYYYAKDTQIVLIEKSTIITAPNKSRTLGV
jgi:hypothetical protein